MSEARPIQWRKSSHSDHYGGDCVEAARLSLAIGLRDSKDPAGPALAVSTAAWRDLTDHIKRTGHHLA